MYKKLLLFLTLFCLISVPVFAADASISSSSWVSGGMSRVTFHVTGYTGTTNTRLFDLASSPALDFSYFTTNTSYYSGHPIAGDTCTGGTSVGADTAWTNRMSVVYNGDCYISFYVPTASLGTLNAKFEVFGASLTYNTGSVNMSPPPSPTSVPSPTPLPLFDGTVKTALNNSVVSFKSDMGRGIASVLPIGLGLAVTIAGIWLAILAVRHIGFNHQHRFDIINEKLDKDGYTTEQVMEIDVAMDRLSDDDVSSLKNLYKP